MSINFFSAEKIIRLTPVTKETKEIADKILEGDVRIFPKLPNVKVGSLGELWEKSFDSSPSTYALYVYALYPVSYLLNAYELLGDKSYLDKAVCLSLNFLGWESEAKKKIDKKRGKILFGDHSVSNRTQAICYLVCCLNKEGYRIPREINSALLRNGEYLSSSDNYSHYNHGLMMDLALLGLLNTLEGLELEYPGCLKENLISRLKYSITRDLTDDGVHVENSPGYHFWMLGFLGKITPSLEVLDKALYLKAKAALDKAFEYAQYITRPDGSVPAIGDTHAGVRYKPSKGLESKFFRHANQVIFRSPDDDVWAHFSSGYKTQVHKHCDNGMLNVYYKGRDVFFDPGFLNYEATEDSLKIKGSSFHNVVRPLHQEQRIKKLDINNNCNGYGVNVGESKILSFSSGEGFELSVAKICDFSGETIFRLVYWIKPDIFLIYDRIFGGEGAVECFWHVAPGLKVDSQGGFKNIIDGAGGLICQLSHLRVSHPDDPIHVTVEDGFYAKKFNTKAPSEIVRAKSVVGEVCTVIDFGGENLGRGRVASRDGNVFIEKEYSTIKLDPARILVDEIGEGRA